MMQILTVGEKAPKFFYRANDNAPIRDGASFNLLENGRPFIAFYLRNMEEEEAELIGTHEIESAYWHNGGFWLGMLKIGEMLQELSFDPMVHYLNFGSFSPDLFLENRIVSFVGIDTADMTIKVMRAATYPWKFLESLHVAFGGFSPRDDYSYLYQGVGDDFDRLPMWLLWEKLTPGGCFGEKKSQKAMKEGT
jgi:hypothetical protein